MLEVSGVSKSFDKPVLTDASFSVPHGSGAFLSGPNGIGKSTILRMIAGVLTPYEGRISFDGKPISSQRDRIAYCPSGSSGFYPRLSARQNLHYFGSLYGLSKKAVDRYLSSEDF